MSEEVNSNDLVMFEGDSGNNDGQRRALSLISQKSGNIQSEGRWGDERLDSCPYHAMISILSSCTVHDVDAN